MHFICKAPAKLILTGEHAVLNNVPALSLAIDLETSCSVHFSNQTTPFFQIDLINFQQQASLPFLLWNSMAMEIESRYQQYLNKSLPIQSVLRLPIDLVIICLYHFDKKHAIKSGHWDIQISGHLFQSRGLGSSASVIISILHSLYHAHNLEIEQQEILQLAITIENRQHGKSSGVDPATILFAGLIKYQRHKPIESLPSEHFSAWLIDTGISESSTGQVVNFVQRHFSSDHPIWHAFKQVSQRIEAAWLEQDNSQLKTQIQHNQQLLTTLGIVPKKVQRFLEQLNTTSDSVGKICGSGSITGDSAGVILCLGKPPKKICNEYGYSLQEVKINTQGAYCEVVD